MKTEKRLAMKPDKIPARKPKSCKECPLAVWITDEDLCRYPECLMYCLPLQSYVEAKVYVNRLPDCPLEVCEVVFDG